MYIIIISIILYIILCFIVDYKNEKNSFNNGYCSRCGNKLTRFSVNFKDCRGYICDKCKTITWVSYKSIDKEFLKNEQNNL